MTILPNLTRRQPTNENYDCFSKETYIMMSACQKGMSGNISMDWIFVDHNNVSMSSIKIYISAYFKHVEINF